MSKSISINGKASLGSTTTLKNQFDLGNTIEMTGSNITTDTLTTPSGSSWTPLLTSSLSNMRCAVFINDGEQKIILGGDSTGAGFNPILYPGDKCIISFSGSVVQQLWARGLNADTASLLTYGVTEE